MVMRSWVSMLSLIRTGIPCSEERGPFVFRSSSSFRASESASGLISITELRVGPVLSIFPMRSRYSCVTATDEDLPSWGMSVSCDPLGHWRSFPACT